MLPEQRKRKIVGLVTERDGCSVTELAEQLDFSKATVRRDLQELKEQSLIERSHGGAVPVTTIGREQPYGQREVQRLDAKVAIAERATEELREGQVVFFDSGTTTIEVAKRARELIMAVTNSPFLALELEADDRAVKLTGGTLRHRTRALVGPSAESFMDRMNFDLLFLGTNGIDSDGLMTPNEDEARMKSLMVENAQRVVVVADATKFGERSFVRFADLPDVDRIVTNENPSADIAEACETAGVSVVEAQP